MWIVEINALDNGAHRNQSGTFSRIPDGWAVVPDGMETENFPFGEVEVERVAGVMTVTKWTPGTMPEVKNEKPIKTAERLAALEAAMLEMAIGGAE